MNASLGDPSFLDLGHTEVAYRKIGAGPPLLVVHGYPLSGQTWRNVVPKLAERFTCYVPDLAGAGETRTTDRTDFTFTGQARTLQEFVDRLGLESYSILGHDTGGTIARVLAISQIGRIARIVLIGTEMPNHRPAFIELFQKTANPKRPAVLRMLMRQRWFRRSPAAFGGVFTDLSLIDGDFYSLFVEPIIQSKERASGQIRYLLGIDWAVVDGLREGHAKITAPTLLIWGEDDRTFPIDLAREMARQFPDCRLVAIPGAKLFVHEEMPDKVAQLALEFLTADTNSEVPPLP